MPPARAFVEFVSEKSIVHISWRGSNAIARLLTYRSDEVAGRWRVHMQPPGQPPAQPPSLAIDPRETRLALTFGLAPRRPVL
jgi:hypothetical protein